MRILHINCVYNRGSTGKIVADLRAHFLADGHDMLVCYGRPSKSDDGVFKISSEWEAKVHSLLARLWGVEFGYSPLATSRLCRFIRRHKPDVVHLHCLNGHFVNVYRLVTYLKKHRIPTVLTLHAEDMHTAGCAYAVECTKWETECHHCPKIGGAVSRLVRDDARHCYRKMKRAFAGFDTLTVVGVSEWLTTRASRSPIFSGARFATVHNGVNTAIFSPQDTAALREKLHLSPEDTMVLYVTPHFNNPMKGGDSALAIARRMPHCRFVFVGCDVDLPELPPNVTTIAHTQDQRELAAYYTLANATLLPSLRETFSMVTVESLCCGTPVVGYESGAPETITLPDFSTFVPQGDLDALQTALERTLNTRYDTAALVEAAHKKYTPKKMAADYLEIYNSLQ